VNELLFAYALGALLAGATVFACLYPVILNLRQDLFIREKQLNLYTQKETLDKKVGQDPRSSGYGFLDLEDVLKMKDDDVPGLAKAIKEFEEEEGLLFIFME